MKRNFLLSLAFSLVWLGISISFALGWGKEVSYFLPAAYVWWVIVGIALLPGFLMSMMFFSNLLHWIPRKYPDTNEDTTIIMCAYNEEANIARAIHAIMKQAYCGHIRLLVVDNRSTDRTKQIVQGLARIDSPLRCLEYVYCETQGKAHALNCALKMVHTPHFLTVDADTVLERNAVQQMMNHIVCRDCACVAGNLFVENTQKSLVAKMQIYDYLLSIAAVKRFQGSYDTTLVAQGAFSVYNTALVRRAGGWRDVLGEDIVLTYTLLSKGGRSTYEPKAVGYTHVPETLDALYNQRKRWAIGMMEGLSAVPPWKQKRSYSRHFVSVNLSVIYLDFAFLLGMLPAIILALFGYYYLAGVLTLVTVAVCGLLFLSMYRYQKNLNIPFRNSLLGFVCFLFFFQLIQSTAAAHGYLIRLFRQKGEWQ